MQKILHYVLIGVCAVAMSACEKEEAKVVAPVAPVVLTAPTTSDAAAWKTYLSGTVKQNMEGIKKRPYVYYIPAAADDAENKQYDLQLDNVEGVLGQGVLPGNMIAFGSPDSTRMADLVVDAFAEAAPGSLKNVRVLFIGAAADMERVKAAVEPSAGDFRFVEAK